MKRRFRQDDDDAGLDSLLDTMTNVVGILILVLIVTQMGVTEKVASMTANFTVTEQELQDARVDLEKQQRDLQKLREQEKTVSSINIESERERLKRMEDQLTSRQRTIQQQTKQANEFALRIDSDRKRAAELEKEMENSKAKRQELDVALKESIAQRTRLTALLDKTPRVATPRATAVRIPDPRPAPAGAREATFVCAHERVFPLRLTHHRNYASQAAKQLIAANNLDLGPAVGIDPVKFTELFVEMPPPADAFFTAEYYVAGNRWPRIRFIPQVDEGASIQAMSNRSSGMMKLIKTLNPQQFFCRFYVLPDSYAIYAKTRRAAARQKLLAGWEPQSEDWLLTTSVPGVELGPPRPKPPPPANPPPPRKPPNVID